MRHSIARLITKAACALGLTAFLSLALISTAADVKKEAPVDLTLTGLDGKKVHLHDFAGKPLVINIWATWCLPCREEMPMMVEAEKAWAPKGVMFIAASLDDSKTKKNIPAFVKQYQITFPVWSGATPDDLDKLKLGEAVPDTAFLDGDHIIFSRARGEIHRPELDERLEWVTGDRTRPAPQALIVHLDK
jgi:thiol-disulfide isomerase/thioredoxin